MNLFVLWGICFVVHQTPKLMASETICPPHLQKAISITYAQQWIRETDMNPELGICIIPTMKRLLSKKPSFFSLSIKMWENIVSISNPLLFSNHSKLLHALMNAWSHNTIQLKLQQKKMLLDLLEETKLVQHIFPEFRGKALLCSAKILIKSQYKNQHPFFKKTWIHKRMEEFHALNAQNPTSWVLLPFFLKIFKIMNAKNARFVLSTSAKKPGWTIAMRQNILQLHHDLSFKEQ